MSLGGGYGGSLGGEIEKYLFEVGNNSTLFGEKSCAFVVMGWPILTKSGFNYLSVFVSSDIGFIWTLLKYRRF